MLLPRRIITRSLQTPCLLCRNRISRIKRNRSSTALRSLYHNIESSVVSNSEHSIPPPYLSLATRKKPPSLTRAPKADSLFERQFEDYSPTTDDLASALREKLKSIPSLDLVTRADRQVCFSILFRLENRNGLGSLDGNSLLMLYNMATAEPARLTKYRVIRISYGILLSKGLDINGNGFLRYLVALIYTGNPEDALRIWDQQRATKYYDKQWWWTAGAMLFIRLWKMREAESVINGIKERFGSADPHIYAALVYKYCLGGQIVDARRCYETMTTDLSDDSRPPRWKDYEMAFRGFLLVEDNEYMSRLVNDMEKAGYGGRKGQLLAELIFLTRKDRTGLPVSNSTSLNGYIDQIVRCMPTLATDPSLYEIWLLRLGQLGDGDGAMIIYKHMLSKAMPIWPAHARCIMLALLRQGDSGRAVDFLQEMELVAIAMNDALTLPGQIPCPDASHYLLMIQYYGEIGDRQGVENILTRMAELRIWPDAAFFAYLLDYYRKAGRFNEVWESYHRFCQSQVSFGMPIFRAIWDAFYAQAMMFTKRTFPYDPHSQKPWLSNPSYCPCPMKVFSAMINCPNFVMEDSLLIVVFRTFFARHEFSTAVAVVHLFMERFSLEMNMRMYTSLLKTLLIHGAGRNVVSKSQVMEIIQPFRTSASLDTIKYCVARCIRRDVANFEKEVSAKIRVLSS